ncbi:MAG: biotin--[acetyl-CoA-carboxylase] ligase [Gammaproteobacteria bacterium]|nr:biotin--[acetyl-CoA-carboxylase] ligase [Gammaproteobacteria bacterium]NNC76965.1 biotin--[acetyl-CoA-carboxylase] ligase [Woeseiaceae bacterium]
MTIPDSDRIRSSLTATVAQRLDDIDCFGAIDSTNSWLMQQPAPKPGRMRLAVVDHQTAGRGRHGRTWRSAAGNSLCMSLSFTFDREPESLPSLTLAVGVAVAEALGGFGLPGVMLKWPNDLLVDNAKLGGILTESRLLGGGHANVVTGVGINMKLTPDLDDAIQSDWNFGATGLDSFGLGNIVRDELAGAIVNSLSDALDLFEGQGIQAFERRFESMDWLRGQQVIVESSDGIEHGVANGIASDGALLLQQDGGPRRIIAGTVRPADAVSRRSVS